MTIQSSVLQKFRSTLTVAAAFALIISPLGAGFSTMVAHAAGENPTTNAATNITQSNATLNAVNGSSDATGHSFWVSTSTIDTSSPTVPSGAYTTQDYGAIASSTAFSGSLTDAQGMPAVTPNTTYHYVAWSEVGGTWYPGNEQQFTTSAAPGGNTAPVANADSYSTNQDTALTVGSTTGVLANDTDTESDALTAALVSNVSNGTLVLNSDGSFSYTPTAGYSGSDSFTYKANDGTADGNTATVSLTVNAVGGGGEGSTTSSTVVVNPSNLHNWYFYNDQTDTQQSDSAAHGFVTGPGTPPQGTGSVHLTKMTNDKYGIATTQFAGTSLSDITALSYSTYTASGTSAQAPSLGFDVDSDTTDGDTGYQGRLTYEPYFTQTITPGTWQTWDTINDTAGTGTGNWWFSHATLSGGAASVCTQDNPCTWSELVAAYPHAALRTPGQLILRTNGADGEAFDGNVDNLTVGISNANTVYDFDPIAAPVCGTGTFDAFNLGSVDGQNGWRATGPHDQEIVNNNYGYNLGCKVLRVSDAITSGSFGDWIFAPAIANAVGEADATNGSSTVGTLQPHLEMSFSIAAASQTPMPGSHISVSPDRGDGSRMSYLRFEDGTDGINVFFDDVQGSSSPANFVETQIAGGTASTSALDRTVPHTVRLTLDAVNGPSNDVVNVYIDGTLVHTGTSWENYYRYDAEASAEPTPRIINTMIIQARGTANPADDGYGFVFDNVSLSSSDGSATTTPPTSGGSVGGGGRRSGGGSSGGSVGSTGTVNTGEGQVLGASTFNFTRDLTIGSTGDDVIALQQMLIAAGYLHIPAPTGYFGALTRAAVAAWQAAHGIYPAAGYFGPISRAAAISMGIPSGSGGLTDAQRAALLATLADILKQALDIQMKLNAMGT